MYKRQYGGRGRQGRLSSLAGHGDFGYASQLIKEDGLYADTPVELGVLGGTVVKYVPLALVFCHTAMIVPGFRITVDVVDNDAAFFVRPQRRTGHGIGDAGCLLYTSKPLHDRPENKNRIPRVLDRGPEPYDGERAHHTQGYNDITADHQHDHDGNQQNNHIRRIKFRIIGCLLYTSFCYTDDEFEVIRKDILEFKRLGADGVVIGVLKPDGSLDIERMKLLMEMCIRDRYDREYVVRRRG